MPVQADTPSRMSRQGAARTYHSYINWGYFQRRMALQRSGGSGEDAAEPASSSDSSSSSTSGMAEGGESGSGRVRWEHEQEGPSSSSAAQEQAVNSQRSYAGEGGLTRRATHAAFSK